MHGYAMDLGLHFFSIEIIKKRWQHVGNALTTCWQRVGNALAMHWQRVGNALAMRWQREGNALKHVGNAFATY